MNAKIRKNIATGVEKKDGHKKVLMNEISLWKKRYQESKKVLETVYKDVSKDAEKAYREIVK